MANNLLFTKADNILNGYMVKLSLKFGNVKNIPVSCKTAAETKRKSSTISVFCMLHRIVVHYLFRFFLFPNN